MPELDEETKATVKEILAIDTKAIIASMDGLRAELKASEPEVEALENWRANKAELQAELEALRAEREEHRKAVHGRQFEIDELKRQRERAEAELVVVQNSMARTQKDYEALAQQVNRLRTKLT